MSKTATRANIHNRPISPHLQIYRFIPTYVMSGVHRVTGFLLYFGTILVVWWLVAAAASERQFEIASWFFGSWIGLLVLLGYSWTLIHHTIGGIKHLVWDAGFGFGKQTSTTVAGATLVGSIVLTVLVWIVGLWVRGGF